MTRTRWLQENQLLGPWHSSLIYRQQKAVPSIVVPQSWWDDDFASAEECKVKSGIAGGKHD
jgi:hypothetical protein